MKERCLTSVFRQDVPSKHDYFLLQRLYWRDGYADATCQPRAPLWSQDTILVIYGPFGSPTHVTGLQSDLVDLVRKASRFGKVGLPEKAPRFQVV